MGAPTMEEECSTTTMEKEKEEEARMFAGSLLVVSFIPSNLLEEET